MRSKLFAAALVAALIVFGLAGAFAQGNRTVLRIDSVKITKTECGKPLEFQIVIRNAGAQGFNREAVVFIKLPDNKIRHQFVMVIPAGQTITDVQNSSNPDFLANCSKGVCFEVSLAANMRGDPLPEWNKVPFKICTRPGSGNVIVYVPRPQ
jgi:hypothetical protein